VSVCGSYYQAMSEAFEIRIDATGPNFGIEALLDSQHRLEYPSRRPSVHEPELHGPLDTMLLVIS
jgi:hypothetical protein